MLNNISWASYTYAISIILLIYYVFVIAIFYRKDLQGILARHRERGAPLHATPANVDADGYSQDVPTEAKVSNETHELLLSLQSLIKKAAARKFPKEELLHSLKLKLQTYPSIEDIRLKGNVNNFIKLECENNCSIHLTEEEVKVLWGEVGGAS